MEQHAIKSNIFQAIFSQKFLFGIFAFVFVVVFSQINIAINVFRNGGLQPNGFCNQFMLNALKSDAMIFSLPIICSLPYTISFVEDMQSGFIKFCLHRITVKDYLLGKVIACLLSGGLVLIIGALISYGVIVFTFSPMQAPAMPGLEIVPFIQPFIMQLILFFISGALWSMVGMTAAVATNSKYMAYASPFILYYILIILKERYFPRLYVLYPKEWVITGQGWLWGDFGVIMVVLELIMVTSILFVISAKRRLNNI